jgi:hypothetical protein
MINLDNLKSEIEKNIHLKLLRLLILTVKLRNLSKSQQKLLENNLIENISELSNKFKFEYLYTHLRNVFNYLESQILLHREIDKNFNEFNYWNYEDWIFSKDFQYSSIMNPRKNFKWEEVSKYVMLEMVSNKPNRSYPYKSWIEMIESSDEYVIDVFQI